MKEFISRLFIFKTLCVFVLLLSINGSLSAQHAVSASGSDISGTGGSISYTVGQVAFEFYDAATGSAALGVQQPYEIYVYPGIAGNPVVTPFVKVFPNPVHSHLTIVLDEANDNKVLAVLYDITWKILEQVTITG